MHLGGAAARGSVRPNDSTTGQKVDHVRVLLFMDENDKWEAIDHANSMTEWKKGPSKGFY